MEVRNGKLVVLLLGEIDPFSCIVEDQLTLFLCKQLPLIVEKLPVTVLYQGIHALW
jgi:hypothetical protein